MIRLSRRIFFGLDIRFLFIASAIQYFVFLPYGYVSYGYHLAWKMISVSRRIFLGLDIRFLFIAFGFQYFVFLPYEYISYGYHSAWKLISVSRRIFLVFDVRFLFVAFEDRLHRCDLNGGQQGIVGGRAARGVRCGEA